MHVLPRVPTFGEEIGGSFGSGLGKGFSEQISKNLERKQKLAEIEEENKAIEADLGIKMPKGMFNEETRRAYVLQQLKGKNEKPLNPLQQAQQKLAEAKTGQIESQQQFFDRLMKNKEPSTKGTSESTSPIDSFGDDDLIALAAFAGQNGEQGIIGNIAQAELDRRKEEKTSKEKKFESDRAYHTGFSKDLEKVSNELRESIPKKEMALNFARNAVESNELGYFSLDKLADITGSDLFRTSKGAQLITAGKENLLSNMSRVSARAQNIWFEQRLNSMFPKIGQSTEANLTVQEMLEGELALDSAYLSEFDRLAEDDEKNFGFVRKDVSKRAHQALKPLEQHIMRRTSYRMKEIEEQENGLKSLQKQVGKNVAKGTPLTLAMAKLYRDKYGENALKIAEKNGYFIPSIEEFESYQNRPQEFRDQLQ